MTPHTYAIGTYLAVQAQRATTLVTALTLLEKDLERDPETRDATTHEVVQRALRQAREIADALSHEAEVLE